MPAAPQRFWRAPGRAVAVGLIAATLMSTAMLESAASIALKQTVDPASRGIYDILVTARDAEAATPTVLGPNSLYLGATLLSLEDVAALRGMPGVEVAAPIALVVTPHQDSWRTDLRIPIDQNQLTPSPENYRAKVTVIGNDGIADRLVAEDVYSLIVDRANAPSELSTQSSNSEASNTTEMCSLDDVALPCELFGWHMGPTRDAAWLQTLDGSTINPYPSDGENITLSLPIGLNIDQRVTLIDPVAEQELLGAAGNFLQPLAEASGGGAASGGRREDPNLDALGVWAHGRTDAMAKKLAAYADDVAESNREFLEGAAYAEYARVKRERGEEPDESVLRNPPQPVTPLIVSEKIDTAKLRIEIVLEKFGPGERAPQLYADYSYQTPSIPQALRDGMPGADPQLITADASALLNAFSGERVILPWPGTTPAVADAAGQARYPSFLSLDAASGVVAAAPHSATVSADGVASIVLNGVGFRAMGLPAGVTGYGPIVNVPQVEAGSRSAEAVYSSARPSEASMRLPSGYRSGVAISTFSATDQQAVSSIARGIPLGAYEIVDAALVEDSAARQVDAVQSMQSVSTFGLAANATTAIGDITSPFWEKKYLVDAVRVRVAGVTRYDAAGIAAVTRTAHDIEQRGYSATIVAGSKSAPARVTVGNYAFGVTDAAETPRVGTLGVLEQRWTVLGAAATAGSSISVATRLLTAVALAAGLGLAAVVENAATTRRRREAQVLRSLGWRRARIMRRFAAEQAIGMALVLASAALALLFAREQSSSGAAVAVAIALSAVIAVWGLSASMRRAPVQAASADFVERMLAQQDRPELRIVSAANASDASAVDGRELPVEALSEQRSAPNLARLGAHASAAREPKSASAWGMQRAWRRRSASLMRALAIATVTTVAGAFAAVLTESNGEARVVGAGTLAELLPTLLLALCGITAGLALIVAVRAQAGRDQPSVDAVLSASGWSRREASSAARAESLAVSIGAVLVTSYALWFVLGSSGLTNPQSAVTIALIAGLLASALLIEPRGDAIVTAMLLRQKPRERRE